MSSSGGEEKGVKVFWDAVQGHFVAGDPARMTAQQRANWQLLEALLRASYARGYAAGLAAGHEEAGAAQRLPEKAIDRKCNLW